MNTNIFKKCSTTMLKVHAFYTKPTYYFHDCSGRRTERYIIDHAQTAGSYLKTFSCKHAKHDRGCSMVVVTSVVTFDLALFAFTRVYIARFV